MKHTKDECCGHKERCVEANQVDTTECPEQNEAGECCGDKTRCAEALKIDGEGCTERTAQA